MKDEVGPQIAKIHAEQEPFFIAIEIGIGTISMAISILPFILSEGAGASWIPREDHLCSGINWVALP